MLKKIDPWFPRSQALRGAGLRGLLCGPRNDAERRVHCVPTQCMGTRLNHSGPLRSRFARLFTLHSSPFRLRRRGISLIEILISMFVMLFGLMGVAAIFPVGNHYVVEGEKFDLGAAIAQNAFEELGARGMLKPGLWLYADVPPGALAVPGSQWVIQQDSTDPNPGAFNLALPPSNLALPPLNDPEAGIGPGHAFVIDPLGSAAGVNELRFPFSANAFGLPVAYNHYWLRFQPAIGFLGPYKLPGTVWPVRRITLPQAGNIPLTTGVAETIFRLRDDLAVEQPDESDVPSIQRWDLDAGGALLRRQYKGDYSWLATVVPTTREAVEALQPAHEAFGELRYDVSVVVFRKRDTTPSNDSERHVLAELLPGGELVVYDSSNNGASTAALDAAFEDVRSGTWIALLGVNQATGDFVMKWYRILSMSDETQTGQSISSITRTVALRRLMLIGPDWPTTQAQRTAGVVETIGVAIFPEAFLVVTKQMKMEGSSLWSLE